MYTRGTMTMARMDEWAPWQRWVVWLLGWALYAGACWLLLASENAAARIVALVGLCASLLVLTYSSKAVLNERVRSIDRRQLHMVLPALLIYILLMLYVMPLADHTGTAWPKTLIVLSPMLPILVMTWAVVRYVNGCDELERLQHLEAAGVAVVVVSLAGMALGLLAAAKLIVVNGARVLLLVWPALGATYGLTCKWTKWRNRAR